MERPNNAIKLTVRPVTRLALVGSAPQHLERWRAQGARPSRPAAYRGCSAERLAVGLFSMANPYDHNDQVVVLDVVEDSVLPLSESVLLKSRQLLASRRPGV